MTRNYVDTNLCNFTDQIMDIWAARRTEKQYFPDSALSGKIDKDTLQKSTDVKPSVQNTKGENSVAISDGKDDGKISFKEKIKNFGEGLVKPIKTIFSSPKNMVITAASIAGGAALIALTGGAAAPVMVAAGLVGGTVQVGKGIYKQVNAKTDNEARMAWQDMGSGTFTIGASAAGAKSSLKAAKVDGAKNMSTIKAIGKCLVDSPKNIKTSFKNISSKVSATPVTNVPPKATASPTVPSSPTVDVTPEPTVAPTTTSQPTVVVSPEPSVTPTVPSNPTVDVAPEPKVMPTVPSKPIVDVKSEPAVAPTVSSTPIVDVSPESDSIRQNNILALPEPKIMPKLQEKPIFVIKPEQILSSKGAPKSNEILALPPAQERLALPAPKNSTVSEKLGILDRIKRFLNVFGLFLPKRN